MDFFDFMKQHNGSVAVVVTIVLALIAFAHYISVRRAEEKGKDFDRYHALLKLLNGDDGAPYIDQQVAVIYQLRSFPDYYPVSLRILEHSLPRWQRVRDQAMLGALVNGGQVAIDSVIKEAKLSITYLKSAIQDQAFFYGRDE